eukprot:845393_1
MKKLNQATSAQIIEANKETPIILVLKKKKPKKSVTWDGSVVDNEFMNKKKSNKCCIYHKPRRWDESDTESDSSSDYHRDPNYTKPDVQAINDAANTGTTASTQTDPQVTSTQAKSDLEK